MKSMIRVQTGFKKGLAAVLLAAAMSAVPAKAGVVAGGTVPLENYFEAQGVDGLDIQSVGTAVNIANIWINNNAPGSFTLTVTERNGGFLRVGNAAALPVIGAAGTPGTGNPFSAACNETHVAGGTWGPTAVWANHAFSTFTLGSAPGDHDVLTPGAQDIATVDYKIQIDGTWIATTTMLAGYYTEVFTVSLVAVM